MHIFHKWRNWKYLGMLDLYDDGYFWKSKQLWQATCEVCGKPSKRKKR